MVSGSWSFWFHPVGLDWAVWLLCSSACLTTYCILITNCFVWGQFIKLCTREPPRREMTKNLSLTPSPSSFAPWPATHQNRTRRVLIRFWKLRHPRDDIDIGGNDAWRYWYALSLVWRWFAKSAWQLCTLVPLPPNLLHRKQNGPRCLQVKVLSCVTWRKRWNLCRGRYQRSLVRSVASLLLACVALLTVRHPAYRRIRLRRLHVDRLA